MVPKDKLAEFLLKISYYFLVNNNEYEFSLKEENIDYQVLLAGQEIVFNEMKMSYRKELLSLRINKSFPIKKGKNKIILTEQGFILKSEKFFAYDLATPCRVTAQPASRTVLPDRTARMAW